MNRRPLGYSTTVFLGFDYVYTHLATDLASRKGPVLRQKRERSVPEVSRAMRLFGLVLALALTACSKDDPTRPRLIVERPTKADITVVEFPEHAAICFFYQERSEHRYTAPVLSCVRTGGAR